MGALGAIWASAAAFVSGGVTVTTGGYVRETYKGGAWREHKVPLVIIAVAGLIILGGVVLGALEILQLGGTLEVIGEATRTVGGGLVTAVLIATGRAWHHIIRMCNSAKYTSLPIFVEKQIKANTKEHKEFVRCLKTHLILSVISHLRCRDIEKAIVNAHAELFMKKSEKFPEEPEVERFVTRLIALSLEYYGYASEIYAGYQDPKPNLFIALNSAYNSHSNQDDFWELYNEGRNLYQNGTLVPQVADSESRMVGIMAEGIRQKLASYVVNILKKTIPASAMVEVLQDLVSAKPPALVIIGEKFDHQKHQIAEKLREGGATMLVSSPRCDVLFYRPTELYKSMADLLRKGVTKGIGKNHKYLILGVRAMPAEVDWIQKGTAPQSLQRLAQAAEQVRVDQRELEGLLATTGKSIAEIVEEATIDFFVGDDGRLSGDEQQKLGRKSAKIYRDISKQVADADKNTDILSKVGEDELTKTITGHCRFSKDRSKQIVASIKSSVGVWRNIIY